MKKDSINKKSFLFSYRGLPKHVHYINIKVQNPNPGSFKNEYDVYLASLSFSLLKIAGKTIFISSRKEGTLFRISFL